LGYESGAGRVRAVEGHQNPRRGKEGMDAEIKFIRPRGGYSGFVGKRRVFLLLSGPVSYGMIKCFIKLSNQYS